MSQPRTVLVFNKKTGKVFTARSDDVVVWEVNAPAIVVNPNYHLHPIVDSTKIEDQFMVQARLNE